MVYQIDSHKDSKCLVNEMLKSMSEEEIKAKLGIDTLEASMFNEGRLSFNLTLFIDEPKSLRFTTDLTEFMNNFHIL